MSPLAVVAALAVVGGAVVAIAARDGRAALLGLAVSLVAAPLLADPLPDPLPLAARVLAALLAVQILAIAIRGTTATTRGSLVGWPVEALAAAAAFAVGVGISTVGGGSGPSPIPPLALAAALALTALATPPIALGRDVLRLSIGLVILVTAATIARAALLGPATPLEHLAVAGVTVALGLAAATTMSNAFAVRGRLEAPAGHEPAPAATQAHPGSSEGA